MMKTLVCFVKNTLITTGITLCLLALVAFIAGGSAIYVETVFQNLLVNACAHLGFLLTKRFESSYLLLDMAVDVLMVCAVIIAAGAVFGWFSSTPVWLLVIMVLVVYAASTLLSLFRVRSDIRFINEKLKQLRQKE